MAHETEAQRMTAPKSSDVSKMTRAEQFMAGENKVTPVSGAYVREMSLTGHRVVTKRVYQQAMILDTTAWYCARTKPKHEHIAAANVRKRLKLEVFHPQLRIERVTRRGVVRVTEPLFPGYIFVRCVIGERLNDIQRTTGVSSLVHFGDRIPTVGDEVIGELQECFAADSTLTLEDRLSPGDEVIMGEGAFAGMRAFVLRVMPARQRVQVLLDILGGPTPVEVDRGSVVLERNSVADRAPTLALAH